MLTIRRMTVDDIALGMRLKGFAGWNQTPADWQRFLNLQPDGCFVAEWSGQPVGTTTTCVFDSIGWIAMVLVDPDFRGRGIGSRLMQRALDYLDQAGVQTARLDATPLGRPVYERLGFVAEYELARMEISGADSVIGNRMPPGQGSAAAICPGGFSPCSSAAWSLDDQVTGTRRKRLLDRLLAAKPEGSLMAVDGDQVKGYVLTREGSRAMQIGPCVAVFPEVGRQLCDWALDRIAPQPVFMDVPIENRPAMHWALERGFQEQRRLTRMCRGPAVADRPEHLWASSGPELG